ncbi:MAG TPA: hypothetical protein VG168_14025 [Bryobacteraceae bacterium]|jgi:hypothetical protein|nr:hypothetical protein [Bryobacteraceae bacterium]
MPIERQPKKPVSKTYIPGDYDSAYKVQDNDDWNTVAQMYSLDVKALIYYNFHTYDPDEVNWYLRRNVGCIVPTKDHKNWTFRKAKPGIIYIYPPGYVFKPPAPWVNPLAKMLAHKTSLAQFLDAHANDASDEGHIEQVHFVLDVAEVVHIGLSVAGIGELSFGALSMEVAAPLMAEVAVFLGIAAGYADAIESLKRKEYLDGLSEGIVLGANQASIHYVKSYFWKKYPIENSYFPEQSKNLQNMHNLGIVTGYRYGQQLDQAESQTLFHELNARMRPIRPNPEVQYGQDYWSKWGEHARTEYYQDAAIVFRSVHLPR